MQSSVRYEKIIIYLVFGGLCRDVGRGTKPKKTFMSSSKSPMGNLLNTFIYLKLLLEAIKCIFFLNQTISIITLKVLNVLQYIRRR